jgi:Leucine-rich repeat (LRR) protein
LRGLENLRLLNLSGAQVKDVSALRELKNLKIYR